MKSVVFNPHSISFFNFNYWYCVFFTFYTNFTIRQAACSMVFFPPFFPRQTFDNCSYHIFLTEFAKPEAEKSLGRHSALYFVTSFVDFCRLFEVCTLRHAWIVLEGWRECLWSDARLVQCFSECLWMLSPDQSILLFPEKYISCQFRYSLRLTIVCFHWPIPSMILWNYRALIIESKQDCSLIF